MHTSTIPLTRLGNSVPVYMNEPVTTNSDAFLDLIDAAVGRIVATEDFEVMLAWMREPGRLRGLVPPESAEGAERAAATMLARSVWNATPLPGNRFRPRPLPKPARNGPCPCGSGLKYKRCCGGLPAPEMNPEEIWLLAVSHLKQAQIKQAVQTHAIPASALAELAEQQMEKGCNGKAKSLLEPVFGGDPKRLDERHEAALDQLCGAYNALGHTRKKRALLRRLTREASLPMQAVAWQRLASVSMDDGNDEDAWRAFHLAQRAAPRHPALAPLEITLLMAEGRAKEASSRASFWRGKLERDEDTPPELLDFLDRVAADPARGLMSSTGDGDHLSRLAVCVDAAADRLLPDYTLGAEPVAGSEQSPQTLLRRQLDAVGIRGAEAERAIGQMSLDLPDDNADGGEPPPAGDELSRVIRPPVALAAVERLWHAACPVGKPFSTNLQPFDDADPWAPECAERWLALLEQEPGATDSVDVLDDLAAVLDQHAQAALPGLDERCYQPLLRRAVAILDQALEEVAVNVQLPWAFGENRPVLRLLYRYALWLEESGEPEAAQARFQQLLRLNSNDNHGVRGERVNALLRGGEDRAALALCERYPDDMFVETAFGAVLAHYRLGELDAARMALRHAHGVNAHVTAMLRRARVRRPALNDYGVTIGGEDQAWLYRESMRDVWVRVDGLLPWAISQLD